MKRKLCVVFILLCCAAGLFAEKPPIKSVGWQWGSGITLNGKWFYDVAESYREQDGWAVVQGRKLHYWLYDTYTYCDGYGRDIVDKFVPKWIESMGYVIDFDNVQKVDNNNNLASSVKALMKQRGCDVSVALITDGRVPYVVINDYDKDKDMYRTIIYNLIK